MTNRIEKINHRLEISLLINLEQIPKESLKKKENTNTNETIYS